MSSMTFNPAEIRCFCSFVAKRTNDNVFVCGRYKSGTMVCLFHLHEQNLETYYQSNKFPMSFDCEKCLITLKIHSKTYMAPCPVPWIRCGCGDRATFHQSKKDNSNNGTYFFGCPNWQTERCKFFSWSHEYHTTPDLQILRRLMIKNDIDPKQAIDHNKKEEVNEKLVCIICFSGERSHLITPCNHLCCCSVCATQIVQNCPVCRGPINSIQRIFFA